jgi:hypothetical protein
VPSSPQAVAAYLRMDDDELHALSTAGTARLRAIDAELDGLQRDIGSAQRKLRWSGFRLGLHSVVSLGGLIAAPVTFGWSLLLTMGDGVLLGMELDAYGDESFHHHLTRMRAHELRLEAAEIDDRLGTIRAVLEERGSPP